MALHRLKSDGVDSAGVGNLAGSLTGDWIMRYEGIIHGVGSYFNNLFCIGESSGSDYISISTGRGGTDAYRLRMLTPGNTSVTGTIPIVYGTIYVIEIRYVQSTNTLSLYIDDVLDFSENPTNGTTWIPNLDVYRIFTGTGSSSYGNSTMISGDIIDEATPANSLELRPSLSGGAGTTLHDASANANHATLTGFSGSYWTLPTTSVTTSAISNMTEPTVQGFACDADYWYLFDSTTSGGFVDELKKMDKDTDTEVASNSTPFSTLPVGTYKFNDGFESGGLLYVMVVNSDNSDVYLLKYDISDLSLDSYVDVTATGAYVAGCCEAANGNILTVGYATVLSEIKASRIVEITKAGAFVANHTIDQPIYGGQGITLTGSYYLITSHDSFNNFEVVFRLSLAFEVLEIYKPTGTWTEIEGIYFFDDEIFINDIKEAPVQLNVTLPIIVSDDPIADAGSSQTVSAGALVTLDGSNSDPVEDGTTLTYLWSQTSGDNVTLSDTTASQPTFIAPTTIVEQVLVFSLTVDNGVNSSVADTTSVTVLAGTLTLPEQGFTLLGSIEAPTVTGSASNVHLKVTPNSEFTSEMLALLDSGGGDLRFGSLDGSTTYPCHVVDGLDLVWIKAPGISISTGALIHIWGNKTGETQPSSDSEFGSENVWSDFQHKYLLNDGSTENATDNGDLTLSSGTAATRTGKFGNQVLDLSGDQYMLLANAIGAGTNEITIDVWALRDSTGASAEAAVLGSALVASDDQEICLRYDITGFSTGRTEIYKAGLRNVPLETNPSDTAKLNQWQHLTLTKNSGTTVEVFIDGVSRGTVTCDAGNFPDTHLYVGAGPKWSNQWKGGISDVGVRYSQISSDQRGIEQSNQDTLTWWTASNTSIPDGVTVDVDLNGLYPVFNSDVTVSIPDGVTVNVDLNGLYPVFNSDVTVSIPDGVMVDVDLNGLYPVFNSVINVLGPGAVSVNVDLNGLYPVFNSDVTVSIPDGVSVNVDLNGLYPVFNSVINVLGPGAVSVNVDLNGLYPVFNSDVTVSIPDGVSINVDLNGLYPVFNSVINVLEPATVTVNVNLNGLYPAFTAVLVNGIINAIIGEGTNITTEFKSNNLLTLNRGNDNDT